MGKLNSKVFYKMYFTNMILMIGLVSILAFSSSHFSSKFVLNKIMEFNRQTIEDRSEVLEDKIRQMNEVSDLAVSSDKVMKLMLTSAGQYISPLDIQKIIRELRIIRDNYSLVDEIDLVDYERELVINSQTKMSLRETIYKEAWNWEPLSFSKEKDGVQIYYTKNWNPVQRSEKFSIILTLNQTAFKENLFIPFEELKEYLLTDGQWILAEEGMIQKAESGWEKLQEQEFVNAEQGLTAYVYKVQNSSVSIVGIWDNAQVKKEANQIIYKILLVCVVLVIFASGMLYISALSFYRPLKKLKERVSEIGLKQKNGERVEEISDRKAYSEYGFIESVIHSLRQEKQQIEAEYEKSFPVISQNMSSRLITEDYQEEAFLHLLEVSGCVMDGRGYILLILECKNQREIHQLGEYLKERIHKENMETLYFEKSADQGTFLINTNDTYGYLIDRLKSWKQETSEIVSTWCVSSYFTDRSNMNLIYWETLERLKKKFFKEKNSIIFGITQKDTASELVSDVKISQRLFASIKEGKEEETVQILHDFTRELSNTQSEKQYIVFLYFSICSKLVQDLKTFGIALSKEYDEKIIVQKLIQGENIYDLEETVLGIIKDLGKEFQKKESVYSSSIKKAVEFIEQNYHNDLILEDVANEVYLSAIYLSNIFKKETGYTVMEYITQLRMKEARELLVKNPVIKVKDIAEKLGYRNVQSFIRYFKIYYGVTPVEFRRKYKELSEKSEGELP